MNVSNTFTESAFGSPLSAVNDWANNAWAQIYNNYTPQQIQFWGGVLIQFTTFWIPATIYVLVDVLFPEFSERHQYQEKKRQPKGREILRAALGSLQNNVAVTVLQYVGIFYVNKRPMFVVSPELPSLWTIAWQFVMVSLGLLFFHCLSYLESLLMSFMWPATGFRRPRNHFLLRPPRLPSPSALSDNSQKAPCLHGSRGVLGTILHFHRTCASKRTSVASGARGRQSAHRQCPHLCRVRALAGRSRPCRL